MKRVMIIFITSLFISFSAGAQIDFENDVQPIFTNSCALTGCHAGANPQQGMSLEAGEAFDNIVNVPSMEQPSLDRIEPGEPTQSYLYLKIIGDASITGVQMPFGSDPLDSTSIATIRQWIEEIDVTSVESPSQTIPEQFELFQNYPNPFNPNTQISYYLPESGEVRIAVYDLLGKEVRVLADGRQPAGLNSVTWHGKNHQGRNVSSGIYIYRVKTKSGHFSKKMLMVQ